MLIIVGKHDGKLVCHLLQDLNVLAQTSKMNQKRCMIYEIQNIHHIVCVYLWLETLFLGYI